MKNIAPLISHKQKKSLGSSSNITNLAAATHDNNTDSIVDQDVDVVLADVPIIPSYLHKSCNMKLLMMI